MAEKLPTFENVTPIQPGPVVSAAPQFAAAQKVVGNLEDMVNKNLQRKADTHALAEGGLAGEDLGFVPLKGGGRATQIYNLAALRANKYTLAADIGSKAGKLGNELGQDVKGNQTLDEFRARYQGYADGLLSGVPKQNHAYAKNLLQAHGNAQLKMLQTKITKQNNEFAFVTHYQTRKTNKDIMANASFKGNGPMAIGYHVLLDKHTNDGIKGGWLTPAQAKNEKLDAAQSFNTNRLLYKYQLAQKANKTFFHGGKTDESKIMDVLNKNADKNFVQRILRPEGKPVLDLGKGKIATHEMAWSTVNGQPIVYPKVIQDPATGKLKQLSDEEALKHALAKNEFIGMKDNKTAQWFSSNYKKVWDIKGKNIAVKDQFDLPTKKFRKIFMKDPSYDKIFSPQDRMGMMSKFDQLDKIEFDKQKMTQEHLSNMQKNMLFTVAHGGEVNQDQYATLISNTKSPYEAEDLAHKVNLAKQTWSWAAPHQYTPVDQQVTASRDLKTITPEGIARSDSLDYHNSRLNAAKQVDNFKSLRLTDPVAQLQNSPVLQKALADIDNGELHMSKAQAMINYQTTLKQPDNLKRTQPNVQSVQDVQNLNQLAVDPVQGDNAVLAALVDKRASDPATFHYYFNGLTNVGLKPKYQTMMNMWMNPENRANIDVYQKAWRTAHMAKTGEILPQGKEGKLLDEQVKDHASILNVSDQLSNQIISVIHSKVLDKGKDFISTLTTMSANNEVQIAQVTKDLEMVAKYQYAVGKMKVDDAVQSSYDMIIGKIFPVITDTYRVPFDIDADHVKSKMHELDLAIKRGDTDLRLVAGEGEAFGREQSRTGFIRRYENKDLFMGGHWRNNPNGRGYIKTDISDNPIYDNKTGEPYGFSTDAMKIQSNQSKKPSELSMRISGAIAALDPLRGIL